MRQAVATPQTTKTTSPEEWAALAGHMGEGLKSFKQAELSPPPPREEIDLAALRAEVVLRGDDLIFQLFPKEGFSFPSDRATARTFLALALEKHFGSTDSFEGAYTGELDSWALKAKGLHAWPTFTPEYHIYGFVQFLSDAVEELKE